MMRRFFTRRFPTTMVLAVILLGLAGCVTNRGTGMRTAQTLSVKAQADEAYASGHRDAALQGYEHYVQGQPDDSEAWARIGSLYLMGNQPEPAIHALKKAVDIDKGNVQAWHNLAVIRMRQAHAAMMAEYAELAPQSAQRKAVACKLARLTVIENGDAEKMPDCLP